MPGGLDPISPSEDLSFQLWMDFENVCDRYISLIGDRLASISPDERDSVMERTYLVRTIILASRRDQRTFHTLLKRARAKPWYKEDRERLSRYVALVSLFPSAFENPLLLPSGMTTTSKERELSKLATDHPYLFDGSCSEETEECGRRMDGFVASMDAEIWGDKDEYDLDIENEEMLGVQEIDPEYLEEALAILNAIRGKCYQMAVAGPSDLSLGALNLVTSKEHETSNMLARFVLECMFLRYLRSTDPREDGELMANWQTGIELGRVEMETSKKALDMTLNLLIEVHGSDDVARGLMSQAAQGSADLIGRKALAIMVYAVTIPPERCTWPSFMHDLVILQMKLNMDPEENIRRMNEQCRIDGRPALLCTTQLLKAACYEKRGLKEKAALARLEVFDLIMKNRGNRDVLLLIPEATHLLMANNEKSTAKKLLEIGLKVTAARSDLAVLRLVMEETFRRL